MLRNPFCSGVFFASTDLLFYHFRRLLPVFGLRDLNQDPGYGAPDIFNDAG